MEGQHGGAADAGTVQHPQRQTLHEGQRRGFGGAVVYGPRDGRLGQDGVYAHHVAVLQLQHPGQEGFNGLGEREKKKKKGQSEDEDEGEESVEIGGDLYSVE